MMADTFHNSLDQLHLVHARLLFIISEMYAVNRLTNEQKLYLKCNISLRRIVLNVWDLVSVFKDDAGIMRIYEQW